MNSKLTKIDRYCITNMKTVENKTVEEIASFINKPVKTVQNFIDKNIKQQQDENTVVKKDKPVFIKKTVSQKDGVNIMTEVQSSRGDNKKTSVPKKFNKSIHKILNEQE